MRRLLLTHVRATFAVLVAALIVVGIASAASAHGDLVGGSPGPGDELGAGVDVLRLDLREVDGDAPLSIAVTDDGGDPIAVGEAQAVDADVVCAASAPLGEGIWTLEYAGTGTDGHRFGGRYAFEVVGPGVDGATQVDPGVCAAADLADPGEALTLAEMTESDAVPGWVIGALGALGLVAMGGVVLRVRRDRALVED